MLSFEEKRQHIQNAISARFGDLSSWWIVATFEDSVIVSKGDQHFRIPYTLSDDDQVSLGEEVKVQITYTPLSEGRTAILGPILSEGQQEADGSRWQAVLIEEGISINRTRYCRTVLEAAVGKYDGVPVHWNHESPARRSSRDIVGFISHPAGALLESAQGAGAKFAITGVLNVTSRELREGLLEAYKLGRPQLYGLSHEAYPTKTRMIALAEGAVQDVEGIESVAGMAVVSYPSAGGRVERLIAGNGLSGIISKELAMLERMVARLKEKRPDLWEALGQTPTDEQVMEAYERMLRESAASPPPRTPAASTTPPTPAPAATVTPPAVMLTEAEVTEFRVMRRRTLVTEAFEGRTVPDAFRARIRQDLEARPSLTLEEAQQYIDGWIATLGPVRDRVTGVGSPRVELVADEADKLVESLTGLFFQKPVRHLETGGITFEGATAPPFRSLKEAYVTITGDRELTQRQDRRAMGRFERLHESVLYEAMTTSSWAEVLGDSIRRALIADYRTLTYYDDYRRLVSTFTPAADFRTMRRMRIGGYGDLPTVSQGGPYTALTSPTDEEVTYAISKKGGTDEITWEMIVNDDVGGLRRIPTGLSRASKRTRYKGLLDLLANNSNTVYDATALAAAGHNNVITTALSQANATVAKRLMADQTAYGAANDFLNDGPRFLIVPSELEELAWRLTQIPVVVTSNQNATEQAFQRSAGPNEYMAVRYWTDADNYWFVADPAMAQTFEFATFQGRDEPELLVQDMQNVGSMFTADKVTYKIRDIWGVVVIDHRSFVGGIVP